MIQNVGQSKQDPLNLEQIVSKVNKATKSLSGGSRVEVVVDRHSSSPSTFSRKGGKQGGKVGKGRAFRTLEYWLQASK